MQFWDSLLVAFIKMYQRRVYCLCNSLYVTHYLICTGYMAASDWLKLHFSHHGSKINRTGPTKAIFSCGLTTNLLWVKLLLGLKSQQFFPPHLPEILSGWLNLAKGFRTNPCFFMVLVSWQPRKAWKFSYLSDRLYGRAAAISCRCIQY